MKILVEKSVPLLKVVKPDGEEGADDGDENGSTENQNIPARSEGQNGAVRLVADDHRGPTEDGPPMNPARQPDVGSSSTDPGKQLPLTSALTVTSAGGPLDEAGLRPSAARRLVGQGLMNLSLLADVPGHQTVVDPATFPVVTSYVPSGRQIKGIFANDLLGV